MERTGFAGSLTLVLVGCLLNNVELEFIISKKLSWTDPSPGGLLTFLQFLFISLISSAHVFRWRGFIDGKGSVQLPLELLPTRVPLREYLVMTAYFCVMSFLNNLAFAFHISQPMHMVFRSSNLMVSYAYGWLVGKHKHDSVRLASVLLLTFGAVLATLAEAKLGDTAVAVAALNCDKCGGVVPLPGPGEAAVASGAGQLYYLWWMCGVLILTTVLVLQTLLGARQDDASKKYGKAPYEAMFYMHAMSLPALAVLGGQGAFRSWGVWMASPQADAVVAKMVAGAAHGSASKVLGTAFLWACGRLSFLGIAVGSMPVLWLHVALNVVTQWVCLAGVYAFIAQADQLTVNVALTVRKFLSLMVSIALFGNMFSGYHWGGAACVFGGAVMYGCTEQVRALLAWVVAVSEERTKGSELRKLVSPVSDTGAKSGAGSMPSTRGRPILQASTEAQRSSSPAANGKGRRSASRSTPRAAAVARRR